MNSEYSLSTFNKEVMWNQRRNFLSYIDNGGVPTSIRLRMLRDGYDYSSAVFSSIQKRGTVLFGINFAVDGGNTHISLDRINGKVEAEDFRLRFEIGGCLEVQELQNGYQINVANIRMYILNWHARFGTEKPSWEYFKDAEEIYLDFVLYHGERRLFEFTELDDAVLGFNCCCGRDAEPPSTLVTEHDEMVTAVCRTDKEILQLSLFRKPMEKKALLLV